MSRRECIYVSHKVPFKSPPSPNSTVDAITAEIRLFYPPNAKRVDVLKALADAYHEAWTQLPPAS